MKIVLGVSGGIAAYKSPDLVRRLQDRGATVRVILTANGARFVSPLALAAVSGAGVITDQWGDASHGGVDHVELARWADLLLIAPATANILAKLATGLADDALSTYALAHRARLAVAPAMNTFMLAHPTVVANIATLRSRGALILEPDSGVLACGDEGAGRMPDPDVIARRVFDAAPAAGASLAGRRVVVTAGPTREAVDPVRYLTNRSSGKMGYALADAARRCGAEVVLITGPSQLMPPPDVRVVRVEGAAEMQQQVFAACETADVLVMAAAVADYTPVEAATKKIKRSGDAELVLRLRATGDILKGVSQLPRRPLVVAFAAETDDVVENARAKLRRKKADLIVANDVSDPTIGFDVDENQVTVLASTGESYHFERAPKSIIAARLLELVAARLDARAGTPA